VKHSIKKALERDAKLDAKNLSVETNDGTVTVTGTVGSWAEHDSAIAAAWSAPGVKKVEDHVLVGY
jgi:osmotically-inducible protein OsmY